ncbi:UNVERIFIED_CONTAM: hypothetical protein K2H54_028293 [Gekko kuhli]
MKTEEVAQARFGSSVAEQRPLASQWRMRAKTSPGCFLSSACALRLFRRRAAAARFPTARSIDFWGGNNFLPFPQLGGERSEDGARLSR